MSRLSNAWSVSGENLYKGKDQNMSGPTCEKRVSLSEGRRDMYIGVGMSIWRAVSNFHVRTQRVHDLILFYRLKPQGTRKERVVLVDL